MSKFKNKGILEEVKKLTRLKINFWKMIQKLYIWVKAQFNRKIIYTSTISLLFFF